MLHKNKESATLEILTSKCLCLKLKIRKSIKKKKNRKFCATCKTNLYSRLGNTHYAKNNKKEFLNQADRFKVCDANR